LIIIKKQILGVGMMKIVKFGVVFLAMLLTLAVSAFAQPALVAIAEQAVNEGSLLSFAVTSSAADNPSATAPVAFSFCDATAALNCVLSTPNAAGFSQIVIGTTTANLTNTSMASAQFNWTPSFTQEGTYRFNVTAADGDSKDSKIFTVTVTDVPPAITASVASLALGSDNQQRSNQNHDNVDSRIINLTQAYTITNSGREQLTGLSSAVTLGSDASRASKSSISLSDLNNKVTITNSAGTAITSLSSGDSATVTVVMSIPAKLSAVDSKGVARAWNVASLAISGTRTSAGHTSEQVTSAMPISMQAENRLRIKKGKITFGTRTESISNNDDVKKIKPGDSVEIEIEAENRFKDSEDVTIENIEVTVKNDDDLDVDESETFSDLDAQDKDIANVNFEIDSDVPRGDQKLEILLLGEDEFGAVHGELWNVNFQIDREDHEIDIRKLSLSPETISCEKETTLTFSTRNTGRHDEKHVFIRVSSPDMQYSKVSEELLLDQDDEATSHFTIPVPESAKAGTYRITVDTYYDTSAKSVSDGVILRKADCAANAPAPVVTPAPEADKPVVVVTPTPTPQPEQPEVPQQPVEEQKSFFDSIAFIVLLVLGYVLVLGGGALVALKLLRK
jgi:hypothetical protein